MRALNSRQEELDSFFSELTPWDILFLRKKIEATNIELSGLHDLPQELVCEVLVYLDFDDYRCCTRVCRKWKETWKQEAVLTRALNQFFPGLQVTCPETSTEDLYLREIQRQLKWRQPYSKHTWIPWDIGASRFFTDLPEFHHRGTKYVEGGWRFHYNKKKLAWQSSERSFVIDDLRTRQRLRFIPPGSVTSGAVYQAIAVSDQLLVLVEVDSIWRAVHIVHLETREWKRLSLPAALKTAYLDAKVVYFVTQTKRILYFTWGGKLKELNQTKLECPVGAEPMLGGEPKVLIHPTKENVVFVVKAFSYGFIGKLLEATPITRGLIVTDGRTCSFLVAKFEDGKAIWQKTTSISNPLKNPQPDCHDYTWVVVALTCRKSDNHGTFCLGVYRVQAAETSKLELCPCCEPRTRRGDWGAITFNLLTETFGHHEYLSTRRDVLWDGEPYSPLVDLPSLKLQNVHLWNDDLLLTATTTSANHRSEIYMQTLHPLGSHQAPSPQWTPTQISFSLQINTTQVFQDDEFVILPTLGGLVLYEPSAKPSYDNTSNDIIIDDTWPINTTAYGTFCYLTDMTQRLELKHTEVGCGLRTRNERNSGQPASPPINTNTDQWSPDSTDSEDFEEDFQDHYE